MIRNLLSSVGQQCYSYLPLSTAERQQVLLQSLSTHIENNDASAIRALFNQAGNRPLLIATLMEPTNALLRDVVDQGQVDVFQAMTEPLSLDMFKTRAPDTGRTLLMHGAQNGSREINVELVTTLNAKLKAKYPPFAIPYNENVALQDEIRAIVNAQDQDGNTALMLAALAENELGLFVLQKLEADFFIENKNRLMAVHLVEHLPDTSPVAQKVRAYMENVPSETITIVIEH